MRIFTICFIFLALGCGLYYSWDRFPNILLSIDDKIYLKTFRTLEVRYLPDQIIHQHRKELLKNEDYSLLEPKLTFYPYLFMEVKFTKDLHSTEEGVLLWGLTDGEIVTDTGTWEKTHGFEDCLIAKATQNDFKVLKALADAGGVLDHQSIYQKFKVDSEVIDTWIESCRKKKLVVVLANKIRLHFQNPKLKTFPITRLEEPLVGIPSRNLSRAQKRYSASQIRKLALIAFGNDFAIRKMGELFLPVYSISIQNPDGSVLTTHWNALTGKRMETYLDPI